MKGTTSSKAGALGNLLGSSQHVLDKSAADRRRGLAFVHLDEAGTRAIVKAATVTKGGAL